MKLSVILPVYNSDRFIRQSVQSILNQTFRDFELIIIDDGSKDKTEEILKSFKDKQSLRDKSLKRIKIIKNPKNLGVAKSLNIGLKESKGEYVARCDADDINIKDRFKKQVNFLDKHPDYVLVGSQAELINNSDKKISDTNLPVADKEIRKMMFIRNPILHPSVVFRRKALEKAGFYNE